MSVADLVDCSLRACELRLEVEVQVSREHADRWACKECVSVSVAKLVDCSLTACKLRSRGRGEGGGPCVRRASAGL